MIMNRTEINIVTIFFVLSVFYTESLLSDQAYIEDYVDGDSLDLEDFSEEIFDFEEPVSYTHLRAHETLR